MQIDKTLNPKYKNQNKNKIQIIKAKSSTEILINEINTHIV